MVTCEERTREVLADRRAVEEQQGRESLRVDWELYSRSGAGRMHSMAWSTSCHIIIGGHFLLSNGAAYTVSCHIDVYGKRVCSGIQA